MMQYLWIPLVLAAGYLWGRGHRRAEAERIAALAKQVGELKREVEVHLLTIEGIKQHYNALFLKIRMEFRDRV